MANFDPLIAGMGQAQTPAQMAAAKSTGVTPGLLNFNRQMVNSPSAAPKQSSNGPIVPPSSAPTGTGSSQAGATSAATSASAPAGGNNQNPTAPAPNPASAGSSVIPTTGTPSMPTMPAPSAVSGALATIGQTPEQMAQGALTYEDQAVAASQDIINSIESSFGAAISQEEGNAAAAAAAGGFGGSATAGQAMQEATAATRATQASTLATALESIRNNAASVYETMQQQGTANAQYTIAQFNAAQTQLQQNATALGKAGITPDALQTSNHDEWNYLVQYGFNGDANLAKAYMLSANTPSVVNSSSPIMTGTTATYITSAIGPDGKPTFNTQSLDLSSVLQHGEQVVTYGGTPYAQSVSSDGTINLRPLAPQKPVTAGAYGSYVFDPNANNGQGGWTLQQIDPLTGQPVGSSSGGSGSSSGGSPVSPQVSSYITNVSSGVGVDPSTPLSTAITSAYNSTTGAKGINAIIDAQIAAEGGSLPGVSNNPGNIKYDPNALSPGETDSGVKAKDGGTFASFKTMQDGKSAMAAIIQNVASGNSSAYGPNPTLADYLGTYSNTTQASTPSSQNTSTGLSIGQYGLLANVSSFNPNNGVDSAAFNYLTNYLSTGTIPTSTQLGFSTRSGVNTGIMSRIETRAQQLYYDATGQTLPNSTVLKGNQKLVNANNALLNSLTVQESTISQNSALLQSSITAENINQNAPIINNVIDGIKEMLGNPDVSAYLAQNATLSNELGSLLALKNASGTTVHDKLISAGLISPNASAAQEAATVNRLMQEAQNAHSAITQANFKLYTQTDPLQIDPQNPLNSSMSFKGPDGSSVSFDAHALTADQVNTLLAQGYEFN